MGYAQELSRSMSGFSNFAISFTIISILSGCLTVYSFGLQHGGPPLINWGWLGVGTIVCFVGLSMAEICSSFPTAGGLYYWSAKLAPGNSGPWWSWFTGWFNLLGQVAITAGISFGCAFSWAALFAEYSGNAYWLEPKWVIGVLFVVLALQGILNTFSIRLVALLNDISVWWHLIGVAVIVAILFWGPADSASHNSFSFMFGSEGWNAFAGLSGFTIPIYVALVGLLNAQYTFTGYDASAHVSEETVKANVQAAKGIFNSIWVSLIAGFILLVGVSYAIPDFTKGPVQFAGSTMTDYASFAVVYPCWAATFVSSAGRTVAMLLIVVVGVAQFYCGMSSVTANSRMIYAFSRDGAVPGHRIWHTVSKKRRVPVASAWFGVVGAFLISLPYLWNYTAYNAVVATAVVGLYIAYMIPVILRRINAKAFVPGPYKLNPTFSFLINWIAIVWVIFICIIFLLPPWSPVTVNSFNYSPVVVGAVIGFAGVWWLAGARKWFKGPKVQGTPEELAAIERDLAQFDLL
jgi:amino acid transporter